MSITTSLANRTNPSLHDHQTVSSIVKKKIKQNKNGRTKFMPLDISVLHACGTAFGYFPDNVEVSSIATILGKSHRSIKVWFQNVRQRKITISLEMFLDACKMISFDLEDS